MKGNNSSFLYVCSASNKLFYFRFVSDGTIEYNGFRAVYSFIPNPLENIPFISKCEFEIGGATDYIGKISTGCPKKKRSDTSLGTPCLNQKLFISFIYLYYC